MSNISSFLVPVWVKIIGSITLIILALIPMYCNKSPTPISTPCEEVYEIIGTAFYENGETVISNRPIKIFSQTLAQHVTASDGSFIYTSIKGDCDLGYIKIGIDHDNDEKWTTITLNNLVKNKGQVDLGEVVFPVKKKNTNIKREIQKKTKQSNVIIKYPLGVENPVIEISPPPVGIVKKVSYSKVTISKGGYLILLYTAKGVWRASFTALEEIVPSNKFTFHPNK